MTIKYSPTNASTQHFSPITDLKIFMHLKYIKRVIVKHGTCARDVRGAIYVAEISQFGILHFHFVEITLFY